MKKYFNKNKLIMALAVSAACALPLSAMARVSGVCGDCHTMHNSQGGDPMSTAWNGDPDLNVYGALTKGDCVGCHAGTNVASADAVYDGDVLVTGAVIGTNIPYVLDLSKGLDLAGGNFAWVNEDKAKGHNVLGLQGDLDNQDTNFVNPLMPPGGTVPLAGQLTCAGINGCHGDRNALTQFGAVSGGHHGTSKDVATMDGTDLANSYRMLLGVKGIEDDDWEKTVSASDHNQYYGVDRTQENTATAGTISALCAACHGEFHADVAGTDALDTELMGSPWIRHPTDFDMSQAKGTEYAAYGGAGVNAYVPGVPVASNLAGGVLATVLQTPGDAIVTCLSCHRAHGSPYADMLRWDYTAMIAHDGSGNVGCFACHTTKDDV